MTVSRNGSKNGLTGWFDKRYSERMGKVPIITSSKLPPSRWPMRVWLTGLLSFPPAILLIDFQRFISHDTRVAQQWSAYLVSFLFCLGSILATRAGKLKKIAFAFGSALALGILFLITLFIEMAIALIYMEPH